MEVVSVQVGPSVDLTKNGKTMRTSIVKSPVEGAVAVRELGLDGDTQTNKKYHGGPQQAVYMYPAEHYPHWAADLQRDLPWGAMGENLTVRGLSEEDVRQGDRFAVGTAELVVTKPRQPCNTFAHLMEDKMLPKRFLATSMSGFYLSVAKEGEVQAGDRIERLHHNEAGPTIAQMVAEIRGDA